jgi:hypothetical protein
MACKNVSFVAFAIIVFKSIQGVVPIADITTVSGQVPHTQQKTELSTKQRLHSSFPRLVRSSPGEGAKRESRNLKITTCVWIPVFTGMTSCSRIVKRGMASISGNKCRHLLLGDSSDRKCPKSCQFPLHFLTSLPHFHQDKFLPVHKY